MQLKAITSTLSIFLFVALTTAVSQGVDDGFVICQNQYIGIKEGSVDDRVAYTFCHDKKNVPYVYFDSNHEVDTGWDCRNFNFCDEELEVYFYLIAPVNADGLITIFDYHAKNNNEENVLLRAGFKHGLFHGPFVFYETNSKYAIRVVKGQFDRGKRTGKWTYHRYVLAENQDTLVRQLLVSTTYENDLLHGAYQSFYLPNSGQLRKECQFKNGLIDGQYLTYRESGVPEKLEHYLPIEPQVEHGMQFNIGSRNTYRNQIKHGIFMQFYEDGSTAYERYFDNDTKVGVWREKIIHKDSTYFTEGSFVDGKPWNGSFYESFFIPIHGNPKYKMWIETYENGEKTGVMVIDESVDYFIDGIKISTKKRKRVKRKHKK